MIYGALVNLASPLTAHDFTAAGSIMAWDNEIYDPADMHDNSIANSKLIVPAIYNGQYGILTATISLDLVLDNNGTSVRILKNGTTWLQSAGYLAKTSGGNGQSASGMWLNVSTGPVLLVTGDYYEVQVACEDGSVTCAVESSFSLYCLTPSNNSHRVLCKLSADKTTQNYSTPTAIAFDGADVYDTDNLHDPAVSNTQIIIPSSLNGMYGIFTGNASMSLSAQGGISLAVRKNNSVTYPGFGGIAGQQASLGGTNLLTCFTHPILLTTGDFFELLIRNADTSVTLLSNSTGFGMRTVG